MHFLQVERLGKEISQWECLTGEENTANKFLKSKHVPPHPLSPRHTVHY